MVLLCFFVLSLISDGKNKKGKLSCRLGDGRLTKESISLLHHHLGFPGSGRDALVSNPERHATVATPGSRPAPLKVHQR